MSGLWQRYKAEYKKQNARPLPVKRFWLDLIILMAILITSAALLFAGKTYIGAVALPITLIIIAMVYQKRPEKYKKSTTD